ncbi:MAG TPA: endopeptidase La, partial [Burkholderiales bacterium]|nr:endopeptidase La [Burkholderiales bacterium]
MNAPREKFMSRKTLPEDALIIVPMRASVLFPGTLSPVTVGRPASVAAAQEATQSQRKIGFLLQRDAQKDVVKPEDLYWVGTAAQVVRDIAGQDGAHHLIVQGESRFRVLEFLEGWPFMVARVETIQASDALTPEVEARFIQLKSQATEAIGLLPNAPEELATVVQSLTSPGLLADMVANLLDVKLEEKQALPETFDLGRRLDRVLERLGERIGVLRVSKEIGEKTQKQFTERQREHVLREQMRQIQKELGEGENGDAEIAELRKAVEEAGMPEDVHQHAVKELKRLERMGEGSAEGSMLRTYLEWLSELPWKNAEAKPIDIAEARKILDEDHFGLDKIKRRILEHLAVRKLNPGGKSPILCFVGPPGVGKTSLGQSIARATGRKFQRIALGGVHDEAEIRGHRRTYIGALPGSIIQAIRRAESRNTVLMFDEIDKLGMGGFHGDPSSALLEVLDPEQNSKFRDNYLGVDFDLSKVMFITTANMLDTIPGPLRDRMEIIQLPGYTEEEKLEIAKKYLVKRQLESNGLDSAKAEITEEAIRAIIADYTREAGVRSLERTIGAVLRNAAMKIAEGSALKIEVKSEDLRAILGQRKFESELAQRTSVPGVATGLAWTPVGGDILFIEASKVPGSGKLIITGQLGDVMKESAQAALSLVKARAEQFGIAYEVLEKSDIHIHVPAGATPKDGPSA